MKLLLAFISFIFFLTLLFSLADACVNISPMQGCSAKDSPQSDSGLRQMVRPNWCLGELRLHFQGVLM